MVSMTIPSFEAATKALPLGRYGCDPSEVEAMFVADPRFANSSTRRQVFDDWLAAKAMIDEISPALVECAWVGGSFVTERLDPDDVDSLFIISKEAFDTLSSNRLRGKLMQFNKKGWLRQKTGLRAETFVMVRHPHALPWQGDGVRPELQSDFALRGAWDDWWLRVRLGSKEDAPILAEAEPVRGYLEVRWP